MGISNKINLGFLVDLFVPPARQYTGNCDSPFCRRRNRLPV